MHTPDFNKLFSGNFIKGTVARILQPRKMHVFLNRQVSEHDDIVPKYIACEGKKQALQHFLMQENGEYFSHQKSLP